MSFSPLKAGLEFLSGPITGVFVGHGLDLMMQTHPWFLVLFCLLGAAAGFRGLYKTVTKPPSVKKTKENLKDDD